MRSKDHINKDKNENIEINFHQLSVFFNNATKKQLAEYRQYLKDMEGAKLKSLVESIKE